MSASPLRVLQVAEGAAFAGIETHVLALAGAIAPDDIHLRAAVFFDAQLVASLRDLGVSSRVLRRRSKFDFTPSDEIADAAREVDVIHSHGYLSNIHASRAARHAKKPHVITVHGHREPFSGWNGLKMGAYMALDHRAARRADRVIAVSNPIANEMRSFGVTGERLRVVANGLADRVRDIETRKRIRAEWEFADADVVVGFVGRFDPVKAPLRFVEVAAQTCAKTSNVNFVMAGDGPLRAECERRTAGLGIGERVRFLGFRTDIDDVIDAFDILLMTSDSEGVPQALLAAMRGGIPAVCSAVGGIPDILAGMDELTATPHAEALSARLIPLVRDAAMRAEFGAKLRERFEREYTADVMAARIAAIYREVVS
ncbi:MAG: glycosyltransferase family 4 protein [Deltaproteobacteria bacterium]|nr:glycosyltransferase family 4 protein [Deltaproteobacteria bacterium]